MNYNVANCNTEHKEMSISHVL